MIIVQSEIAKLRHEGVRHEAHEEHTTFVIFVASDPRALRGSRHATQRGDKASGVSVSERASRLRRANRKGCPQFLHAYSLNDRRVSTNETQ